MRSRVGELREVSRWRASGKLACVDELRFRPQVRLVVLIGPRSLSFALPSCRQRRRLATRRPQLGSNARHGPWLAQSEPAGDRADRAVIATGPCGVPAPRRGLGGDRGRRRDTKLTGSRSAGLSPTHAPRGQLSSASGIRIRVSFGGDAPECDTGQNPGGQGAINPRRLPQLADSRRPSFTRSPPSLSACRRLLASAPHAPWAIGWRRNAIGSPRRRSGASRCWARAPFAPPGWRGGVASSGYWPQCGALASRVPDRLTPC
jgi:hypothetical protein